MDANNTKDYCSQDVLNLTNEEMVEEYLYSSTEDLLFTVLLPIVETIGVAGNLAFIVMVIRVPTMQTVTNAYLVNIAVADLLFIGYGCTFYLVTYFTSPVRNDMPFTTPFGCVIVWFPTGVTYFASILLITLVTTEKYYAICRPFEHRLVTGKVRTVRLLVLSWILAGALSGLTVLRYAGLRQRCVLYPDLKEYSDFPKRIELCVSLNEALFKVFSEVVAVVPFFLALIGNVYMYGRIIHALSHRYGAERIDYEDSALVIQRKIRNQVARILIINGLIFFCCQFPYRLLSINLFVKKARGEDQGFLSLSQYGLLAVIGRGLVLINSCVNPIVYLLSSSNYRQGFRDAFCGKQSERGQRRMTNSLNLVSKSSKSTICVVDLK